MGVVGTARLSWGRVPAAAPRRIVAPVSRSAPVDWPSEGTVLGYGLGRSYGDSCLNSGQTLVCSRWLDRLIAFDAGSGALTCEAGVSLEQILGFSLPRGWFLPTTPGTQFVTLGGAIANDVHGKNHHAAGSIGHHVDSLELLRSDGSRIRVSRVDTPALFAATVGGLGLTGFITEATLRLRKVRGPWIEQTVRRFRSLEEFFEVDAQLKPSFEHTVAWVDCVAPRGQLGRGLYMAGNHTDDAGAAPARRRLAMPVQAPFSLVGRLTLRAFNALYFNRPLPRGPHRVHYQPFFYPLDAILDWNRIYGPRGFYQFQCVVPPAESRRALTKLLQLIAASGAGSFLAVLKTFGQLASEGILSFPRPGTTLALDFPNHGQATDRLFRSMEEVALEAGGALYPAKDAHMTAAAFRAGYPRWEAMLPHIDPRVSSNFWRRVTGAVEP